MSEYHLSVLLGQSVAGLNINPSGTYADLTFGGGGHTAEILKQLGPDGRLLGFDQDYDAYDNLPDDGRFTFVHANFQYLKRCVTYLKIDKLDGILADLGVSSHHFDAADRGFSFRFDADLDMRMNRNGGKSGGDIINTYSVDQLTTIFRLYGEINNAFSLATKIVDARSVAPIKTTTQLKEIAAACTIQKLANQYLAKVFQAIRLEVNQEIEVLKRMLLQALEMLKPGGRLSVMSYHSLEDRLVKNFMKTGNFEGKVDKDFFGNISTPFRLVNRKLIVPDEEEIAINSRARSAKLRIAEKK